MSTGKSRSSGSSSSRSTGTKNKNSTSKASSSTQKRSSGQSKSSSSQKRQLGAQTEMRQSILSMRIRNDLIGVVLIVLAIILMIAVIIPGDAIASVWISNTMHNLFGVGSYIAPVLLAAFGICFFFLGRKEIVLPRVAIGEALLFISVISLFAVNAPGAVDNQQILLQDAYLFFFGGYVGNGIAYLLLGFVGQIIACVILVAILIASFIIVGLSISGFFDWLLDKHSASKRYEEPEFENSPYARARGANGVVAARHRDAHAEVGGADAGNFIPATQAMSSRSTTILQTPTAVLNSSQQTAVLGHDFDDLQEVQDHKTRRLSDVEDLRHGDDIYDDIEDVEEIDIDTSFVDFLVEKDQGDSKKAGSKRKSRKQKDGVADLADAAAISGAILTDAQSAAGAKQSAYKLPNMKLLKKSGAKSKSVSSEAELRMLAERLQDTLHEFNVEGDVVGWVHGPTVTLFKVALQSGVRVNKITALADDIALAFASQAVRIFSPIAGTSLVGIEIPNDARDNVLLGDVLPPAGDKPLLLAIGKDVEGNAVTADLAKMPHLLIGGTTGSGKSVSINSMIMSVLMRATPEDVRMILIDPKRVELSLYNDIPHLFVPVVTDPHKAAATLAWAVTEMDRRLRLLEKVGARNITQYSQLRKKHISELEQQRIQEEIARSSSQDSDEKDDSLPVDLDDVGDTQELSGDKEDQSGEEEHSEEWEHLPSIMIVIDELADLMMVAGKDVETSISRLAQLARAAGIHLIVATQRPSTNVITGLIKANITNRIAFNVASGIDSRVILDTTGAEHLVGLGDLLFSKPEFGKPVRIQGCFVSEDEINDVCDFLKAQGTPDYHEDIFTTSVIPVLEGSSVTSSSGDLDEDLMWKAAEIVVSSHLGSTSAIQRRLKVGYARAGRLMDMLEDKGIVGPANGSKPREVYVDDLEELEGMKALAQNDML